MRRMSLVGWARHIAKNVFKGARMLKAGDMAPDFEVENHRGERTKLSDLRGRKVVLWFYPKADTPG